MNKKLLAMLLVVLLCVVCIGGTTSAYAATSNNKFDNTDVLDDLKGSTIGGKAFNLDDYPLTTERTLKVIALLEYCYSADVNEVNNYGLYIYVYNPSGKKIVDSSANKLQMCVAFNAEGKAISYDKYELKVCDLSKNNLFIKLKVIDSQSIYPMVYVGERRYDVSGIELKFKDQDVIDYAVSNSWTYTGFSAGCGVDKSTLTCTSNDVETVKLDVHSTYYRYQNNLSSASQVSSVWFAVDNELLSDYGFLKRIKATWFETHTQPMLVFSDQSVYNALLPFKSVVYNNSFPYGLQTAEISGGGISISYWTFGRKNEASLHTSDKLCWMFCPNNGKVSSAEVLAYCKNYGSGTVADKYSSDLFMSTVDEGRTYGRQTLDISADSLFTLEGWNASSAFVDWWISTFTKVEMENVEDVSPIHKLSLKDFNGDKTTVSRRLLIDEEDVGSLSSFYSQNSLKGKSVYLFRYAVTDYTAERLDAWDNSKLFGYVPDVGYVVWQTAFLDFDIIELAFCKENVETVIPVVSDPQDFIGNLIELESGVPWWVIAIIIVIALIIISCVIKPVFQAIVFVGKCIWFVIKNFFLGIYYIFEWLFSWIANLFRRK